MRPLFLVHWLARPRGEGGRRAGRTGGRAPRLPTWTRERRRACLRVAPQTPVDGSLTRRQAVLWCWVHRGGRPCTGQTATDAALRGVAQRRSGSALARAGSSALGPGLLRSCCACFSCRQSRLRSGASCGRGGGGRGERDRDEVVLPICADVLQAEDPGTLHAFRRSRRARAEGLRAGLLRRLLRD